MLVKVYLHKIICNMHTPMVVYCFNACLLAQSRWLLIQILKKCWDILHIHILSYWKQLGIS